MSPFSGIIDEVAIWDEARSQAQIKRDMEDLSLAVEASGKLAIAWGKVKTQ